MMKDVYMSATSKKRVCEDTASKWAGGHNGIGTTTRQLTEEREGGRKRERERERGGGRERQTDRQAGRQTDRQRYRDRHRHRQGDKEKDNEAAQ